MPKFKFSFEEGVIICWVQIKAKGIPVFVRLAVDTGATITTLPPETVINTGINPAISKKFTEVTMGSSVVICPIVTIPEFFCLGYGVKNLDVICHRLPPQSPVEGLLGLNFLKNFKVTLDFPKNIIEISK